MEAGDEVVILPPFYHLGTEIGDRLAIIIDTTGYILVNVYEYENNPVKLFRNECKLVEKVKQFSFDI